MIDYFKQFGEIKFWVSAPIPVSQETQALFFFFIVVVLASVVCYVIFSRKARQIPPYENLKNLTFNWLLGFGLAGLFLLFFIWQNIPYFSLRIIMGLLIWIILTWLANLIVFLLLKFPKQIKKFSEQEVFKKYLPKSGSKRR